MDSIIIKLIVSIVLLICAALPFSYAQENIAYVDGSIPFTNIKDVNRQAESWGVCSSAYEIMALLIQSKPARAKQVKDLSNGATLAVTMAHVSDGLVEDITPERFNALWMYSKSLGESIPETMRTMILADAEQLGEEGATVFAEKIGATIKICTENLKGQQMYIDLWRELAKSGLLQIQSK